MTLASGDGLNSLDRVSLPITLYPKRSSSILMMLVCTVFILIGVKSGMWLIACFFGLGIPIGIVQLLPGATFLRIEEKGFVSCVLFRETFTRWDDVERFGVMTISHGGMSVQETVGFDYSPSYHGSEAGRRLAKTLADFEGALPQDIGESASQLAAFMTACLEKYRSAPGTEEGISEYQT